MTGLTTTTLPPATAPTPAEVYLASLRSETSRRAQRSALNVAARALGCRDWRDVDWRTLSPANLPALMASIPGAPATRNRILAALAGTARGAWQSGVMADEAYRRFLDSARRVRDTGTREPAGRDLRPDEVRALLAVCLRDPHPAGRRDAALIALAAGTGARRAELVRARIPDLVPTAHGMALRVVGKRGRQRTTPPLTGYLLDALRGWLDYRRAGEWLVTPVHRAGIPIDRPLSVNSADAILAKRAAEAGVPDVTWHDFRRTVATALIQASGVRVAQRALGHADISTTARYDRRAEAEALAEAGEALAAYYGDA